MLSKMETAVFRKFKAGGLPAKVRDLLYLGGGVEAKAYGLERTLLSRAYETCAAGTRSVPVHNRLQ